MLWLVLRQMKSRNLKKRCGAAQKLARYKNVDAARALITALSDGASVPGVGIVYIKAENSLVQLGSVAVDPLIEVLRDKNSDQRSTAARVLGKIRDDRAVDALNEVLRDRQPDWGLRGNAIRALSEIGSTRSSETLLGAFRDPVVKGQEEEIAVALDSLGWQPADDREALTLAIAKRDWNKAEAFGPLAVDKLLEFQEGRNNRSTPGVKDVLEVLGRIGDLRAVPSLLKRLHDDPYHETREAAVKALTEIGEPAVPAILQSLEHDPNANEELILDVLRAIGKPEARSAMEQYLPPGEITIGKRLSGVRHGVSNQASKANRAGKCRDCGTVVKLTDATEACLDWDGVDAYHFYCPDCFKGTRDPYYYTGQLLGSDGNAVIDQHSWYYEK